jgi:hypothetical protein
MPEIVDIVDTETGEIYEEDMLLACAHLWAVKNGWEVVSDEVENIPAMHDEPACTMRWLYVKPVTQEARQRQMC